MVVKREGVLVEAGAEQKVEARERATEGARVAARAKVVAVAWTAVVTMEAEEGSTDPVVDLAKAGKAVETAAKRVVVESCEQKCEHNERGESERAQR